MFAKFVRVTAATNSYKLHTSRIICNFPFQIIQHEPTSKQQNIINDRRYYKNFSHKPKDAPLATKIWYTIVFSGFIFTLLDYKW